MRAHAIAVLVGSLTATIASQELPELPELLVSIRAGDIPGVETLLRSGADPNTRDGSGATALMHATAYAPEAAIRLLLTAGADANATNQTGATALMWATDDVGKVRLLIARGAAVNTARADGMTALASAAMRGNHEVVQALLDSGADVQAGRVSALWPLTLPQIALTTNDAAMRRLLIPAGTASQRVGEWTPPPLSRWVATTVNSWRPQPRSSSADLVAALLNAGADPNEVVRQQALAVPVLSRVAQLGDLDAMRVLLDRGADPSAAGTAGVTPLMAAAVASGDARMVGLLLQHGAAVGARDENGHSALDWALRLGDTEAVRALRRAGSAAHASPPSSPPAVVNARSAHPAVEVALARLQPAGPAFAGKTGCISCHHQSLPAVAVKLAATKGVRIDQQLASHATQAMLAMWARRRDDLFSGNCAVVGFLGNVTYGLFAMAEEGAPSTTDTDAVALCLSGLQRPDGSWEGGDTRPPLGGRNPIVYTALALRALKAYMPPGRRREATSRIIRAREYLRRAAPDDTQAESFKLLGLVWSEAPRGEISRQARRVLSLQRADGGWSQLSTMPSDAYAAGQALHALRSAGVAVSRDEYRKGVAYLLRTQREDGTWYVRSRAIGFQPYFDTGFPHGRDQFISAAATAWAVIALSHAL